MIGLVAIGTVYEIFRDKSQKSFFGKFWIYLSAINNSRLLFYKKSEDLRNEKTSTRDMDKNVILPFKWLNGIQSISLLALIIANVYQLGGLSIAFIIKDLHRDYRSKGGSIAFQLILNSWDYITTIFFFTSGFILAYVCLNSLKKKKKLSFVRFALNHYLNIMPSIVGVLLLFFFIFNPFWKPGPVFTLSKQLLIKPCLENNWANILMVSNWLPYREMCLPQTWFLSALFQLNLIGFHLIVLLHKISTLGHILIILAILVGLIWPAFDTFYYNLPPIMLINNPIVDKVQQDLSIQFFPTYNHLSPYFIGVLVAYRVFNRSSKYKTSKILRMIVWLITILISLSSILITYQWNKLDQIPTLISSIIYSSLHRVALTIGLSWMVHECSCERGGLLRTILSQRIFKIINKLSLQLYLNHLLVIWYLYLTTSTLVTYNNFNLWITSFGVILATFCLSYLSYILFQAPFKHFSKGFLGCLLGCDLKAKLKEYENEEGLNEIEDGEQFKTVSVNGINNPSDVLHDEINDGNGVVIRL